MGPIPEVPGEQWRNVDAALREGFRGLPGGSSLTQLLTEGRGARNQADLPALTEGQILAWADAHHARTGEWPRCTMGPIAEAPGEEWRNVDAVLREGLRGLPAGSSLPRLLSFERGVRNEKDLPPLTIPQILRGPMPTTADMAPGRRSRPAPSPKPRRKPAPRSEGTLRRIARPPRRLLVETSARGAARGEKRESPLSPERARDPGLGRRISCTNRALAPSRHGPSAGGNR